MKEYGILIRKCSGKPYMLDVYKDIDSAKLKILEMISLEQERGRAYFVDNDYFQNETNSKFEGTYYCIKERDVSDWSNYSEYSRNDQKTNSNIIYFNNFKIYNNCIDI